MKKQWIFLAVIFSFAASLLAVGAAAAQTPQPVSDNDVNRVAGQMYCPVCENIPLDVCPTQACAQWRDLIREKLAMGWSDQQVKDYFVAQYGDRVLAEPPRRGLNWLVYILPPIFFVAGAFILYRVLRGMRRATAQPKITPAADQQKDPYMNRLEEELRRRDLE